MDKKVHWNTENPKTREYRSTKIDKKLENSSDSSESHKIYSSMARMSSNAQSTTRYFGYISQLTYLNLDSGVTCCMTPDISDFILDLFVKTDKYIEVSYGHFSKER